MGTPKWKAGICCTKATELRQEASGGPGEGKNSCGTNWKGNIRTEIACKHTF